MKHGSETTTDQHRWTQIEAILSQNEDSTQRREERRETQRKPRQQQRHKDAKGLKSYMVKSLHELHEGLAARAFVAMQLM